jgi:hypothetical protein
VRETETRVSERKCPIVPFGKDHVVEATIVGTAITQFARMAPPPIYGIHRLDGRRPVQSPERQVSVGLDAADDDGDGEKISAEPEAQPAGPGAAAPG